MAKFNYMGIDIEKYNGRYMVTSNADLLKLGMCTPKTLQRGHKGYLNLDRLQILIETRLAENAKQEVEQKANEPKIYDAFSVETGEIVGRITLPTYAATPPDTDLIEWLFVGRD